MYPDFQYLLEAIFGVPMPEWLGVLKTFGFFVAVAFLLASKVLVAELKRKEKAGLLTPEKSIDKAGKEKIVYPHERIGNIVMLALVGGLVGAKIFNAFETWDQFIEDPVASLFSGGGLTFYGGFIVAGAILIYYTRKHKIDIRHFADAVAPALMLAYGFGRLGCHFSGDGDWGIFNSAYVTGSNGALEAGTLNIYNQKLTEATQYFAGNLGSIENVKSLYTPAPSWLPLWIVANNYPHNVINEGVSLPGCTGNYCKVLPVAVFPTSLYEAVICTLLFLLLWAVKKRFNYPLHLFGLYLILNGVERFFIEQIKVNYEYDWGFIQPVQSEIISVLFVLTGMAILMFYRKHKYPLSVSDIGH